jgi:putative transposase
VLTFLDSLNLQLMLLALIGYLASGQLTYWPFQLQIRQIKYLNNIIKPMMGFKAFHSARATLAGIELHHMLRKGQHQQT